MTDDRLLVQQCREGSRAAMCAIYERHKNEMLTVARALLNDLPAAEDVVHDVFVAFAESVDTFELTGSLKGYLATCVSNRARDRLRSAKRAEDKLNQDGAERAEYPSPDQVLDGVERANQVRAALAQLPDEQREVIVLHFKADLTFREIAEWQEASINTVQGRYRYGLDKLRTLLKERLTT
jgi:RNA polymerase sigma-70 factor (ECF subfamily)